MDLINDQSSNTELKSDESWIVNRLGTTTTATNDKAMNIKGEAISAYVFDFEKLYCNKEWFQVFFKFQEKEYNTESLFFVQEVNDIEQIPFPAQETEAVKLANHIFDSYIQSTSSQCSTKKKLCKLWNETNQCDNESKWMLGASFNSPAQAFAELKNSILLELKSDSFPRYKI